MNSSLEETSYSCLFQRRVPLKFFATLARTCRRGMQHSKLELVSKRNKFQLELVSSRDEFHLKSRKISPHLKTLSLSLTLSVSTPSMQLLLPLSFSVATPSLPLAHSGDYGMPRYSNDHWNLARSLGLEENIQGTPRYFSDHQKLGKEISLSSPF